MRVSYTLITALLICLTACSARNIRGPLSHEFLFPPGTYIHQVNIQPIVNESKNVKPFSFKGVVRIESENIKISGLSPFGTTLFKFVEDRKTGKVELTNYIESLKKHEDKFKDYYSILKLLLVAPQKLGEKDSVRLVAKGPNGLPEKLETLGLAKNAFFIFRKYDINGIPEEIRIEHPQFLIDIRVSGYEV